MAVPLFASGLSGGYAQFVAVDARMAHPIPDGLSFEKAAALLVQGLSALHAIRRVSPKGRTVLIPAAAGGVGSLLVQLARRHGARKIIAAVGSERKLAAALALGADAGLVYQDAGWGATLEASASLATGALRHDVTLGASYVGSSAHFTQSTQFGYILPDRTVVAVSGPGAFADGTQDSENAFDARVDLRSRTTALSAYALDHVAMGRGISLDLAARYDRVSVRNRDGITPGGGTGSLDSSPVYHRLNPAVTLTGAVAKGANLSLAWSQASRAPSAIELGCSDPESPCRLPNALAGDPPLRQVIARTVEMRFDAGNAWGHVHAALFRTDSSDDILFVANDASGYGYFRNFGKTRRQGLELSAKARAGRFTLSASYTLLDATYRSGETVNGSGNSSSDAPAPGFEGAIEIRPGNRIPLLPRHTAKAALGWEAAPWLSLDLDMVAVSGVYARGNENNAHQPDGTYYIGPGKTDPYAVFNLGGEVRPGPGITLFAMVRNLFDKAYATAAQLGATAFDAQGQVVSRPFAGPVIDGERPLLNSTFFAPGAPRSIQVGARLRF